MRGRVSADGPAMVFQTVLWLIGGLVLLRLLQHALGSTSEGMRDLFSDLRENVVRILGVALGLGLVLQAARWAGGQDGTLGTVATGISAAIVIGLGSLLTLFLVRQFTAPPWWRMHAWDMPNGAYNGTVPDIVRWVGVDAKDMLLSIRPLDRVIVAIGMPVLAWDLATLIGIEGLALAWFAALGLGYLTLIVSVATASRIPRVLMTRLQETRMVTRRIAGGDYAARASSGEAGGYEELDDLVRDINLMASTLETRARENAELQSQLQHSVYLEQDRATRDPLTGLRNNRYFHESLTAEVQRCARTGETVTIGLIDLDDFKKVNDTFGHQEGDAVLLRVAAALTNTLRPYDLPCRLGGEEFGIIFPSTAPEEAKAVLDRIAYELQTAGAQGHPATFSGGIASFPIHTQSQHALYEMADATSYAVKQSGKARTMVYNPMVVSSMGRGAA
jgi:diguanylate cyclase (GGDEF)-like protein